MNNKVLYGVITLLLTIIGYQFKTRNTGVQIVRTVDTLTVYMPVHDTIYAKPKIIKSKPDTMWMTVFERVPDTNYKKLYAQYTSLGAEHYKLNVYEGRHSIGAYGNIVIRDSVFANKIVGSELFTDIYIPEKRIVVKEPAAPTSYFYLGPKLTASTRSFGGHISALYKSKRERVVGVSVGWDGVMQYGLSYHWKLKL